MLACQNFNLNKLMNANKFAIFIGQSKFTLHFQSHENEILDVIVYG